MQCGDNAVECDIEDCEERKERELAGFDPHGEASLHDEPEIGVPERNPTKYIGLQRQDKEWQCKAPNWEKTSAASIAKAVRHVLGWRGSQLCHVMTSNVVY
jgi:hypothetical protein